MAALPALAAAVLQGGAGPPSALLPTPVAGAQVELVVLSSNPRLSGPAFPPAWLEDGAMRQLVELSVSLNPLLTGALPPSLSWPRIHSL